MPSVPLVCFAIWFISSTGIHTNWFLLVFALLTLLLFTAPVPSYITKPSFTLVSPLALDAVYPIGTGTYCPSDNTGVTFDVSHSSGTGGTVVVFVVVTSSSLPATSVTTTFNVYPVPAFKPPYVYVSFVLASLGELSVSK